MMLLAIATVEAYMLPSSSAPVFVSRPAVRSAAVAMEVEAPKKSKGLGFVNGEMRAAAVCGYIGPKLKDLMSNVIQTFQPNSQIFANFEGIYLGCIKADLCNQVLNLRNFS